MEPVNTTIPVCTYCGAEAKKARLPQGWKRVPVTGSPGDEDVLCGKCLKQRYVLRAITIPVVGPVDGEWADLRVELKEMWAQTTALSNWLTSHYYAADVKRVPGMEKLPPMPNVYLYPVAREAFPVVPSNSVVAVDHAVSGKYRAKRFDVIWRSSESLPNYRYPTPYPVHNKGWRAFYIDERPAISVRIGDRRWMLRLRDGHQFKRQLAAFAGFVDKTNIQGELALYPVRASKSDHRNGVDERDQNGNKQRTRVMCKMVGYFPRKSKEKSGTLFVRTDSDALLVALNAQDQRLWVENCDQIKRWSAEHMEKLRRWSDDQKAEQRPTASFQSRRETATKKYRKRMDSLVHEVSAHLVKYAARRKFATVQYDDEERGYCQHFPWAAFADKIEYKCSGEGIVFERSNGAENTEGARNGIDNGDLS